MSKKILTVVLAVVLVIGVFTLTGCDDKVTLVGAWTTKYAGYDYTYTFNADKTGTYNAAGTLMPFKYEDAGTTITITFDGDTLGNTSEYRIEGKKFIIKDSLGNDVEYTRK